MPLFMDVHTVTGANADDVGRGVVVARDMARYIRPPTTRTAKLGTGTPMHVTDNGRQRTLTTSGMDQPPDSSF
jgi:hypothetical protein